MQHKQIILEEDGRVKYSYALEVCHMVWDFRLVHDNVMMGFFRLLMYLTALIASD